ncbi:MULTISPECIES: hypothetical protein [unclassified Streptomyces]|uniref:hypothetical protein n=1 Tax=unclassified Streptomyces TaxID=2593676 RepID=UPI002DD9380C|nr:MULTISPECIES: hypothetical protein [unclassified Streptomyces]WSA91319.1 hypothetical protein OIE63_06965 [Streptomyces sp. NBC_01795]WSB75643.1 hypothetical protein OHB04_07490 [Streptomyces sp. NBC_01775]WSS16072.1 hypothetical protein OG533_32400 [Streptomyces sp. NBC_01186]WSS44891.1 hypothetical protein OG220_33075 [Streptomyces sp. NBC_01187]
MDELAKAVLGPARLDAGKDVDGPVAEIEVAGLVVGGSDDGEPYADGAGEHPGRHGGGLLILGQGHLGVLEISAASEERRAW